MKLYIEDELFVRKYNTFLAQHEEYLIVGGRYGGYLITHGSDDGEISMAARDVADSQNLCIVCCFPAAVKKRYPELTVLGDWNKTTKLRMLHGDVHATPGLSMEELYQQHSA